MDPLTTLTLPFEEAFASKFGRFVAPRKEGPALIQKKYFKSIITNINHPVGIYRFRWT